MELDQDKNVKRRRLFWKLEMLENEWESGLRMEAAIAIGSENYLIKKAV